MIKKLLTYVFNLFRTDISRCAVGLLVVSGFLSCGQNTEYNHDGKTPLVGLDGNFLYEEDFRQIVPYNLFFDDSVRFADEYIKNWVAEQMLYRNAVRNIPDTKEIDRLVENYRRSLIVHRYQQRLIDQKLVKEISDQEVEKFYNENLRLFVLEEPVVRGLLIKVPLNAPNLDEVRKWYKQNDPAAFEELEKYSVRHAVVYEFFYDKWKLLSEIEGVLPSHEEPLEKTLEQKKHIELKDDEFWYFLNVDEYIAKGNVQPLEYAKNNIKSLLINNNEVDYMRRVKNELYESALEKDLVKFYTPAQ